MSSDALECRDDDPGEHKFATLGLEGVQVLADWDTHLRKGLVDLVAEGGCIVLKETAITGQCSSSSVDN